MGGRQSGLLERLEPGGDARLDRVDERPVEIEQDGLGERQGSGRRARATVAAPRLTADVVSASGPNRNADHSPTPTTASPTMPDDQRRRHPVREGTGDERRDQAGCAHDRGEHAEDASADLRRHRFEERRLRRHRDHGVRRPRTGRGRDHEGQHRHADPLERATEPAGKRQRRGQQAEHDVPALRGPPSRDPVAEPPEHHDADNDADPQGHHDDGELRRLQADRGRESGPQHAQHARHRGARGLVQDRPADLPVAVDDPQALAQLVQRPEDGLTPAFLVPRRRGARQPGAGEGRRDVQAGDHAEHGGGAANVTSSGPRNANPSANDPWSVRLKMPIAVWSWARGTTRGIIEPSAGVSATLVKLMPRFSASRIGTLAPARASPMVRTDRTMFGTEQGHAQVQPIDDHARERREHDLGQDERDATGARRPYSSGSCRRPARSGRRAPCSRRPGSPPGRTTAGRSRVAQDRPIRLT